MIQNTAGGTLNWNISSSDNHSNHILAWDYNCNPTSFINTINAINQYVTTYTLTTSSASNASALQADLLGKTILLIPAKYASSGSLVTSCSTAMQNFVQNGGMVIICGDEVTALNSGIFQGSYLGGSPMGNINTINTSTPISQNIPLNFSTTSFGYNYYFTNSNKVEICSNSGNDYVTYLPYSNGKAIYIELRLTHLIIILHG